MYNWFGLPTLASQHGDQVDLVLLLIHVLMAAAFLGWGLFFVVPLFRYARRRHPNAKYRGLKTRLPYVAVLVVAALEMVILLGVSLPYWESQVVAQPEDDDSLFRVRIVAQQFAWNIHYPGPDGMFGRTRLELVDDSTGNPVGLDPEDPYSADDIVKIHQLHVPINRPVEIALSSRDVIHGFSVPEFRVKQDAIPGMTIPVRFIPTMTTQELRELENDEYRTFEIVCAQLCGLAHYRMRGFVTVETQEEFDTWYQSELESKTAGW